MAQIRKYALTHIATYHLPLSHHTLGFFSLALHCSPWCHPIARQHSWEWVNLFHKPQSKNNNHKEIELKRKSIKTEEKYQWTDNFIIKFKPYCAYVNHTYTQMKNCHKILKVTSSQLLIFTDVSKKDISCFTFLLKMSAHLEASSSSTFLGSLSYGRSSCFLWSLRTYCFLWFLIFHTVSKYTFLST